MYSIVFYRVIVGWLALGSLLGLSGCAVYDSVFHPHRLGTPAMTPEAKAKLRAAEKARHKGLTLANPDADDTPSADGAAPSTSPVPTSVSNSKAYSELPAGTRATYDKQGLLKKSPLVRLQQNSNKLHHYDLSAPPHTAATRDERKMRKHSKNPGKRGAEPRAPAEPAEPAPAPDPTQPAPAPAANASKTPLPRSAAKAPAPRPAKATPKPRTPHAAPTTAPADEPTPAQAAPEKPTKEKKAKKAPKAPKPDPTQPPGSGN
ncbi:hypothetical protein HHL22_17330 [Hymenobacter sp. RP-2-7]|uniref:Uncharacterized protein n=1 Tax=Hymenobacter polaris TaxID=2682546 RepID=A0A7Y0AGK6_9BACT|nr:hypothetical protein [Hymenobacter polaris]NML66971.1 hypothetical protein [Hymenobacter polaris]